MLKYRQYKSPCGFSWEIARPRNSSNIIVRLTNGNNDLQVFSEYIPFMKKRFMSWKKMYVGFRNTNLWDMFRRNGEWVGQVEGETYEVALANAWKKYFGDNGSVLKPRDDGTIKLKMV
jgi:hypothetical protein